MRAPNNPLRHPPREQTVLKRQIDQLVYELYGLTGDEIRIVEENP